MRDKQTTRAYYTDQLGFRDSGQADYAGYLILERDNVQLHFFEFKELDVHQNYGQVYIRTDNIDALYQSFKHAGVRIHPNGDLAVKPWGQKEFSLLDPDNNLLTFGQGS